MLKSAEEHLYNDLTEYEKPFRKCLFGKHIVDTKSVIDNQCALQGPPPYATEHMLHSKNTCPTTIQTQLTFPISICGG